eukprot:CAMPEP_0168734392 /NCGR_PEP_ID=MMETSP0724-20121128/8790_1 /TAXON_ID=265536 /ORGANISM="Amphiprora sp., Strain CCMP467" /LENGTH=837 /DNA_ID=CAMNT_0008781495 /DNA_START=111 /DNA_END=2624 /DNA_ORIENTATION=-
MIQTTSDSSLSYSFSRRLTAPWIVLHVALAAVAPFVLAPKLQGWFPAATTTMTGETPNSNNYSQAESMTESPALEPKMLSHHFTMDFFLKTTTENKTTEDFLERLLEDLQETLLEEEDDDDEEKDEEDDDDDDEDIIIACRSLTSFSDAQTCWGFWEEEEVTVAAGGKRRIQFTVQSPTPTGFTLLDLMVYTQADENPADDIDIVEWVLPLLQQHFSHAILRDWRYLLRGPHDLQSLTQPGNDESIELQHFFSDEQRRKGNHLFHSVHTKFQKVTLVDLPHKRTRPEDDAENDRNYNKKMFLDGVTQSSLGGLEAYHEALVHPAILAHANPKRVAIIGGGEGATLRECLKHKTVDSCVMLEIDDVLVNDVAPKYLPEWNDCRDLADNQKPGEDDGSYVSCFEHPRANVHTVDAIAWFMDRFGPHPKPELNQEAEKFDVIIMDALDPDSLVPFSDILYGDDGFIKAIATALNKDGIFLAQVGMSAEEPEFSEYDKADLTLKGLEKLLEKNGAISEKSYNEAHGEFDQPWAFDIAFMSYEAKANFYAEEAMVNVRLAKRALPTKSGEFPFYYMDGATMMEYQYPNRIDEDAFCDQEPKPKSCASGKRFYDPDVPNIPVSELEVRQSTVPNAGKGVFFKNDAKAGAYLALEEGGHSMLVMPHVWATISEMLEYFDEWEALYNYIEGYGVEEEFFGWESWFVDPGITTFINHGCNGTYNVGWETGNMTELNFFTDDMKKLRLRLGDNDTFDEFYNAFADRNFIPRGTTSDQLVRDVKAGEEVTTNYLAFTGSHWWEAEAELIRKQCLQQIKGVVSQWEEWEEKTDRGDKEKTTEEDSKDEL